MDYKTRITRFAKEHKFKILTAAVAILGVIMIALSADSSGEGIVEDSLTEQVREFCEAIDGVGECRVMISYEYREGGYFSSDDSGRVMAVAVACRGAKRVEVQKKLTDLLCTLFDIGANRVSIFELD